MVFSANGSRSHRHAERDVQAHQIDHNGTSQVLRRKYRLRATETKMGYIVSYSEIIRRDIGRLGTRDRLKFQGCVQAVFGALVGT